MLFISREQETRRTGIFSPNSNRNLCARHFYAFHLSNFCCCWLMCGSIYSVTRTRNVSHVLLTATVASATRNTLETIASSRLFLATIQPSYQSNWQVNPPQFINIDNIHIINPVHRHTQYTYTGSTKSIRKCKRQHVQLCIPATYHTHIHTWITESSSYKYQVHIHKNEHCMHYIESHFGWRPTTVDNMTFRFVQLICCNASNYCGTLFVRSREDFAGVISF